MSSRPFLGSFLTARVFAAAAGAALAASSAASCGGTSTSAAEPQEEAGLPDRMPQDAAPPPPTCTAPKATACGSVCVDTQTDAKNCGACGKACMAIEQCITGKCTTISGFAARKIFLGETDRSGVASNTAWKDYGRNIDGLTTVGATPTTECKRTNGAAASSQDDGTGGIDNAFGKTIIPFISALASTPSKTTSDAIEAGARTPMVQLAGAPAANVPAFALGLVTAENTIAPQWKGLDSRPIAESSTVNGKPKTLFPAATIAGGVLTSGDASTPFVFSLTLQGGSLDIPIRLPRVTMTLAADGKTATNGTISGVVDTEEMVTAFQKVAGAISTSLCSGSTLDTIKQTIRQSSDILVDGTQDPNKDCNAISLGIGFDAVYVAVGAIAGPVAPAKDPCVP